MYCFLIKLKSPQLTFEHTIKKLLHLLISNHLTLNGLYYWLCYSSMCQGEKWNWTELQARELCNQADRLCALIWNCLCSRALCFGSTCSATRPCSGVRFAVPRWQDCLRIYALYFHTCLLCDELTSSVFLCQHLFVPAAADSCLPCPKSVARWCNEQWQLYILYTNQTNRPLLKNVF